MTACNGRGSVALIPKPPVPLPVPPFSRGRGRGYFAQPSFPQKPAQQPQHIETIAAGRGRPVVRLNNASNPATSIMDKVIREVENNTKSLAFHEKDYLTRFANPLSKAAAATSLMSATSDSKKTILKPQGRGRGRPSLQVTPGSFTAPCSPGQNLQGSSPILAIPPSLIVSAVERHDLRNKILPASVIQNPAAVSVAPYIPAQESNFTKKTSLPAQVILNPTRVPADPFTSAQESPVILNSPKVLTAQDAIIPEIQAQHLAIADEEVVRDILENDDTLETDGNVSDASSHIEPVYVGPKRNYFNDSIGAMALRNPDGKYCESGQKTEVFVNDYALSIETECVFQYFVEISLLRTRHERDTEEDDHYTEIKLKSLNWKKNLEVMERAREVCPLFKDNYFVFDGDKKLICNKLLGIPTKSTTLEVELKPAEDKKVKYSILIMEADKGKGLVIDLKVISEFYAGRVSKIPEETIAAIEVILRHGPAISFIPVRRSFYQRDTKIITISGGLELWTGHHQGIAIAEKSLVLNVDKAITTFFPAIPLLDFIAKFMPKTALEDMLQNDLINLNNFLRNVKVAAKTLPWSQFLSLNFIVNTDAFNEMYKCANFEGNLKDYYKTCHDITLKFPRLPIAKIGKNNIPCALELLTIKPNQPYVKKLFPDQNTDIIRHSAIFPVKRFEFITRKMEKLNEIWAPVKQHYKIKIAKNFLLVPAQILKAPTLLARNEKAFQPTAGSWSMKEKQFHNACQLDSWIVINCSWMKLLDIEIVLDKLRNCGKFLGLSIKKPTNYFDLKETQYNLGNKISGCTAKCRGLQMIFFVISDEVDQPFIKTYCKDVLNVASQCMKTQTFGKFKKSSSYDLLMNLCLGINYKLGGTNVCLLKAIRPNILQRATMIMGADVNHSPPGSYKPSIASVVGSIDFNICSYSVLHSQQETGVEIINKLDQFTKSLLATFKENLTLFPVSIVFFRDGVGRGQYEAVKKKELEMIKKACEEMNCSPKITFIIVTKRHNTRFYPKFIQDGVGKPGNIAPGSTIDRVLCHPTAFEFFQCDHVGIMGTSKPSKYSVIYDQNIMTATELQVLIYYLCHTYAYCTKSISIPAPVQYAHNDAYHGKDFTLSQIGMKSNSNSSSQYSI